MTEKTDTIRTIGELKALIQDLDNNISIECSVHKLDNTYIIEDAYISRNLIGEVILQLDIKTDWELTERDEKAFENIFSKEGRTQ